MAECVGVTLLDLFHINDLYPVKPCICICKIFVILEKNCMLEQDAIFNHTSKGNDC